MLALRLHCTGNSETHSDGLVHHSRSGWTSSSSDLFGSADSHHRSSPNFCERILSGTMTAPPIHPEMLKVAELKLRLQIPYVISEACTSNPTAIVSECYALQRDRDWYDQSGDHTRRQIQLETPSLSVTENLRDCTESEVWLVATFKLDVNVSRQIPYLNFESLSKNLTFLFY